MEKFKDFNTGREELLRDLNILGLSETRAKIKIYNYEVDRPEEPIFEVHFNDLNGKAKIEISDIVSSLENEEYSIEIPKFRDTGNKNLSKTRERLFDNMLNSNDYISRTHNIKDPLKKIQILLETIKEFYLRYKLEGHSDLIVDGSIVVSTKK